MEPAFLILVSTGLRRGEVLALRWNDVDWETGRLLVDENLVYTKGTG